MSKKKLSIYGDGDVKSLSIFHPVRFLATGFGSGTFPILGGTFGTFIALLLAWPIHYFGNTILLVLSTLCFFGGIGICNLYLKHMPDNKDPKEVVIDEFAGMWLLLAAFPRSVMGYIIAFLLFRLFDIFKPYPVSYLDRKVVGATGIMLDDIAAACYPILLFMGYCWVASWLGHPVNLDTIYTWMMDTNVF